MTHHPFISSPESMAVTAMNILDGMDHRKRWNILDKAWSAEGMGFDRFCGWVVEIAKASEKLLAERQLQDFPGVYDYEVSYELGVQLLTFINDTKRLPTEAEWMPMLTNLADGFFAQGAER